MMRSIERTLLAWLIGALALGGLLVALVTYRVTLAEMNEAFDGDLKSIAEAVASHERSRPGGLAALLPTLPVRTDVPDDVEIVTQTWSRDGQRRHASDPRVKVPFSAVEGLARPTVDGEPWIVYTSVHADGVVQAAQRQSQRRVMAGESAAEVLPVTLVLVVLVGGVMVIGLRRGLRPLDRAARDVAERSAVALHPIAPGEVPVEITPLVYSINGLITRLDAALSGQRRFLADAAHELRTPVTALRVQLDLLRQAPDEAARALAIGELAAGIERSQRLIQQLLQVSRAEPGGALAQQQPVDLGALVRSVVGALSATAEQQGIDLGADAGPGTVVVGDRDALAVLLTNLVDNALRYTPRGGVVDVIARTRAGQAELCVVDNGPGIPPTERERVFDRFFRGSGAARQAFDGSGLGLAIVKAIADAHAATVSLHTPDGGRGLLVRVGFAAGG